MVTRSIFALFFLGTLVADLAFSGYGWFFFIYLTKWSFILQTAYMVLAAFVSYRCWRMLSSEQGMAAGSSELQRLPKYVQLMYWLWVITMPMAVVVCFAFWTLLDPIWDLDPKIVITYFAFVEHFLNMVFYFVEFGLNRNPFHFKHAAVVYGYAIAYALWSLLHFVLRIGVPNGCTTYEDTRDCPIYGVLDWHHPVKAACVALFLAVFATLVAFILWCITRNRSYSDPTIRDFRKPADLFTVNLSTTF